MISGLTRRSSLLSCVVIRNKEDWCGCATHEKMQSPFRSMLLDNLYHDPTTTHDNNDNDTMDWSSSPSLYCNPLEADEGLPSWLDYAAPGMQCHHPPAVVEDDDTVNSSMSLVASTDRLEPVAVKARIKIEEESEEDDDSSDEYLAVHHPRGRRKRKHGVAVEAEQPKKRTRWSLPFTTDASLVAASSLGQTVVFGSTESSSPASLMVPLLPEVEEAPPPPVAVITQEVPPPPPLLLPSVVAVLKPIQQRRRRRQQKAAVATPEKRRRSTRKQSSATTQTTPPTLAADVSCLPRASLWGGRKQAEDQSLLSPPAKLAMAEPSFVSYPGEEVLFRGGHLRVGKTGLLMFLRPWCPRDEEHRPLCATQRLPLAAFVDPVTKTVSPEDRKKEVEQ